MLYGEVARAHVLPAAQVVAVEELLPAKLLGRRQWGGAQQNQQAQCQSFLHRFPSLEKATHAKGRQCHQTPGLMALPALPGRLLFSEGQFKSFPSPDLKDGCDAEILRVTFHCAWSVRSTLAEGGEAMSGS